MNAEILQNSDPEGHEPRLNRPHRANFVVVEQPPGEPSQGLSRRAQEALNDGLQLAQLKAEIAGLKGENADLKAELAALEVNNTSFNSEITNLLANLASKIERIDLTVEHLSDQVSQLALLNSTQVLTAQAIDRGAAAIAQGFESVIETLHTKDEQWRTDFREAERSKRNWTAIGWVPGIVLAILALLAYFNIPSQDWTELVRSAFPTTPETVETIPPTEPATFTLAVAPTAIPLPPRTCEEIRGTDYLSEEERDRYLTECDTRPPSHVASPSPPSYMTNPVCYQGTSLNQVTRQQQRACGR